jgi:hypothetical protein
MTKLLWDQTGQRFYDRGVDRGVLYPINEVGVPWNGLVSVNEKASGGALTPFYFEGNKYLQTAATEEFEATIQAFTYPDEFDLIQGRVALAPGLLATQQPPRPFNFSYRTGVGNDLTPEAGYKIHLVWGAMVQPTARASVTDDDSADLTPMSWELSTVPPQGFFTGRPSAHFVVDSREVGAVDLQILEGYLYGTDEQDPYMPDQDVVIDILNLGAYPPPAPPEPDSDDPEYVIDGGNP